MNIGGKLLLLVLFLGAPVAHAQGAAKKDAPSAAFAPVQTAPPALYTEPPNSPDAPSAPPQPVPPPPAPVPTEPPAPPASNKEVSEDENGLRPPGARLHNGFYTRLGLGIGYIAGTTENDSTINGWGVAPDVWLGGSPMPGLAIGVTLSGVSVPNPNADITKQIREGSGGSPVRRKAR